MEELSTVSVRACNGFCHLGGENRDCVDESLFQAKRVVKSLDLLEFAGVHRGGG